MISSGTGKRMELLITLAITIIFNVDCAKHKDLTGEVFIVTKGANNIKMGLVPVKLFDQDTINRQLAAIEQLSIQLRDKYLTEKTQLEEKMKNLENKYAEAEFDEFLQLLKKQNEELKASIGQGYSVRLEDLKVPRSTKLKIKDSLSVQLKQKLELVKTEILYTNSSEFVFDNLSNPFMETITNADGLFSFTIADGRNVVLVAKSSRQTSEGIESYFWLGSVSLQNVDSQHLIISNHNKYVGGSQNIRVQKL